MRKDYPARIAAVIDQTGRKLIVRTLADQAHDGGQKIEIVINSTDSVQLDHVEIETSDVPNLVLRWKQEIKASLVRLLPSGTSRAIVFTSQHWHPATIEACASDEDRYMTVWRTSYNKPTTDERVIEERYTGFLSTLHALCDAIAHFIVNGEDL